MLTAIFCGVFYLAMAMLGYLASRQLARGRPNQVSWIPWLRRLYLAIGLTFFSWIIARWLNFFPLPPTVEPGLLIWVAVAGYFSLAWLAEWLVGLAILQRKNK